MYYPGDGSEGRMTTYGSIIWDIRDDAVAFSVSQCSEPLHTFYCQAQSLQTSSIGIVGKRGSDTEW